MADSDTPGGGRHLRYAIIGAGMAGILAGIKLNERGETDYTICEKGDSVGGTKIIRFDSVRHALRYSLI